MDLNPDQAATPAGAITLFEWRSLQPTELLPSVKRLTIEQRFERFHAENPRVYAELVRLARRFREQQPSRRLGIKNLFEELRWENRLQTSERDFRLNNDFHAMYARRIMHFESDLADVFAIRESEREKRARVERDTNMGRIQA